MANQVDTSVAYHENKLIETNPSGGVQRNSTDDSAMQVSDKIAGNAAMAAPAANPIKPGSSATCEPTTFEPSSLNRKDTQTAADSAYGALSRSTKLQPPGSSGEVTGTEPHSANHTDASNSWTTRDSSLPPALSYTQFKRPSPEQVSSIFPSELPPRPLPKGSSFRRLVDPSACPARPAHLDGTESHRHMFRTPDIELHVFGEDRGLHETDRLRRLKFWGLMLIGAVLSMAIGMLIYHLVRRSEENGLG